MLIYWLTTDVILNSPLYFDDDSEKVNGFIQTLGCTAHDEDDLMTLLDQFIKEQDIHIYQNGFTIDMELAVIPEGDLQSEFYEDDEIRDSIISDPLIRGVWYHSGRGFYSD